MSLADSLHDFRQGVDKVNSYISIAYEKNSLGSDLFDLDKQEFIITSAFLKFFILWESFLESAFSKYLIGENPINSNAITCHASPLDQEHALKMLLGTQKYVDWANHEIVKRLAQLYLSGGEPLSSNIASISRELADLKTIRNAAAHLSSTTQTSLDALATRVMGRAFVNTTVARFVMQFHPVDSTRTVFQYYQNILDIAAENIASNQI